MDGNAHRFDLWFAFRIARHCETYAEADAQAQFIADFTAAWVKVMELDRFDLNPDYQ